MLSYFHKFLLVQMEDRCPYWSSGMKQLDKEWGFTACYLCVYVHVYKAQEEYKVQKEWNYTKFMKSNGSERRKSLFY